MKSENTARLNKLRGIYFRPCRRAWRGMTGNDFVRCSVFDGFEYCTARFVGVRTVTEAALLGEFKDFLEVACQLFALHVEGAETLDAWGVDEPTFRGER